MQKKVLIVGSGGREHALAWSIRRSPKVSEVYVAPGNGGTELVAENVLIAPENIGDLVEFAIGRSIDLVVVGPELPLKWGLADALAKAGIRVFGPSQKAAEIEWSKVFAKKLMRAASVPTAPFAVFDDYNKALIHAGRVRKPMVIKADGLAGGKGVYPCLDLASAEQVLKVMMVENKYGTAGSQVVIEDFVCGRELSIHAVTDGRAAQLLLPVQDYKSIGEGGTGPNTGGMGCVGPLPWISETLISKIQQEVVEKTLGALSSLGRPFVGCLYPGLMVSDDDITTLEFNSRLGDPETQVLTRLLDTDILDVIEAAIDGRMAELEIKWRQCSAVCVTLTAPGYPGKYRTGQPISGLDGAKEVDGVEIFHAGTIHSVGQLRVNGGRVLSVTAIGPTIEEARRRAYQAVDQISFDGMYFRRDIGQDLLTGP